jgi:protein TonB
MSNVSIYGKKWIDLVFEDRNQMYGAYQLRQENPRVTLLALFYGVLLFAGFASILIISSFTNNRDIVVSTPQFPEDYVLKVTNFNPPITESEPVAKTTPPNTVTDPVVPPEINLFSKLTVSQSSTAVIAVPTNEDLKKIETPAIQGTTASLGVGMVPSNENGKTNGTTFGAGSLTAGTETISKSIEVDVLPNYPGGITNFYQYVANNFKNIDSESGSIVSVLVAFVVEKDGSLSNIRVLRNTGNGTDKEAIRVLTALKTKWTPGIKNGQKVRTEFTLPIKVKFK